MTRLLILATVILSIVSYASAQFVDTLNTPIGPVTQGAKVAVSWTLLAGAADPGTATGDLSATDSATKNVVDIDPAVPIAPKTYMWNVQVPPGTYTLGINDGSGLKQSGEVVVKAPAGGAAPAPGGGAAPAPPADGGKAAPAPAPAGGKTAAPAPAPADGGKAGPAPAPSAAGGTPSTPSTPSTPAGGNAVSSPAPSAISTGSASSIFSGYDVVLSLLSVAVAMLQF